MISALVVYVVAASQSQTLPPMLSIGKPVEKRIELKQSDSYMVELKSGDFCTVSVMQKGVDLVIRAFDTAGQKFLEVDSPNGTQGEEPCQFQAKEAGKYRIVVEPLPENTAGGDYSITFVNVLSKAEYETKKAREAAELESERVLINDWLKAKAVPLKSVEAGTGFEDLQPLKKTLANVRVVGLGEATHGTREFFQMKHRMVEFLAKEMGYTVFGIEATYAECLKINDYVLRGDGDPEIALRGQYFWTWDTEEVLDMIKWMRAYNQSVPEDKKLKFLGFDVQFSKQAGRNVVAFFEKVDAARLPDVRGAIEPTYPFTREKMAALSKVSNDDRSKQHEALSKLVDSMTAKREAYVKASSELEFNEAINSARELLWFYDMSTVPMAQGGAVRDDGMAQMVMSILSHEPAGTKMVLWAHNAHVQKKEPWMGLHLSKQFGDKYYVIGFAFDEGSFQAMNSAPKEAPGPGLNEFVASPGGPRSLGWFLRQPGYDQFFVDFRDMPTNVAPWWHAERPLRQWGAMSYQPALSQDGTPSKIDYYDGLIFVRKTTRARPNAAWKQPYDPNLERPNLFGP